MEDFIENRCKKCNKLIFKSAFYSGVLQVKCPRCNSMQLFETITTLYDGEKMLFFSVDKNYIIEKVGVNVTRKLGKEIIGKKIYDLFQECSASQKSELLKKWKKNESFLLVNDIKGKKMILQIRAQFIPRSHNGELNGYFVLKWIIGEKPHIKPVK